MNPGDNALLVVDDNEDNLFTLTRRLRRDGYTNLVTATNGRQALELLLERNFDLVLLDIMMPEMDGYQVLEQIKGNVALRDIPVIMISALEEIDSVVRCIELGAVDYLTKPFNPVLLRARVAASLEKKSLRDALNTHVIRMEKELDAARRLQLSMVPHYFPPPTPKRPIEIFAIMEPAREIGGDLYDFFYCPDGSFCFLIGDVSGKGAAAGLFMVRAKSLVRMAADLLGRADAGRSGPAEILATVNQELCQDNAEMMFVTVFLGILHPGSGKLSFCNAAHNLPYRLSQGALEVIGGYRGLALGIMEDAPYVNCHLQMNPAEAIYLFTDGITEATNDAQELFSDPRLEAVLSTVPQGSCEGLIHGVARAVADFVAGAPQADDITAMAVRWSGKPVE